MKNFKALATKLAVLLSLAAPLALASDTQFSSSSLAEPMILSICGVILIAFGLLKDNREN